MVNTIKKLKEFEKKFGFECYEELKDIMAKQVEVYVYVNNHYEGSAPKTIQKILDNLNAI